VVKELVARTKVDPNDIEELILGNAMPEGEQGMNMGRYIVFLAGLPITVGGSTINRWCGSSMQAIHMAAGNIAMGVDKPFVCAGVESMTRVPMGGFNPMPNPGLAAKWPETYFSMGTTAEKVAEKFQVTRKQQEEFAARSQQKAGAAMKAGKLKGEIVGHGGVDQDGCVRPDTTPDVLAGLKPAFDAAGTVTAGTSSPTTDGASAVLVCSEDYARARGWTPLARIKAIAGAGCEPEIMGMGPVAATKKALDRAGLKIGQVDIMELNEAFASQALACIRQMGIAEDRVNLDGGAIALGHPLGATGARITGKAAQLLRREGKKYAVSTQCIGGGQGIATVLEAV
jgi:acetyl-CoA acyltransferase